MKKRLISMLGTMTMLCLLIAGNVLGVSAQDKEKIVDGSYLTDAEESRGTVSEDALLRGKHLMEKAQFQNPEEEGFMRMGQRRRTMMWINWLYLFMWISITKRQVIGNRFILGQKMRKIHIMCQPEKHYKCHEDIIIECIAITMPEM